MLSVIYFVCLTILASTVFGMHSSKVIEGYSIGYLSDCPGSTKEAIITKNSLKYLTFTILGPGSVFSARRITYTYYQMKALAKDPDLDFKRTTLLFIGGYLDSTQYPVLSVARIIGKFYADRGYNVLLLDTNRFTTMVYPRAARFTRPVGKHVAEMLANLTKIGLNPKKLEVMGLSLGGQTISLVAKNYKLLTGMNISRLTALDPSGPCFRNLGPEDRLDQTDADFVDVIDTNVDGYGMAAPVGHSNFYVNGGEFQLGDVVPYLPCTSLCSHVRSFTLWLAILEHPDSFIALKCESVQQAKNRSCYDNKPRVTNLVGPKTDKTKHGVFYLSTSNDFPYFRAEKGLVKENDFYEMNLRAANDENVLKV